MTEEGYASYLTYLAGGPPDVWRDTNGMLYLAWLPTEMYPTGQAADSYIPIPPGDQHYGRYLDDLLSQFDYAGMEVPHVASADHDAAGG